MNVTTYGLDIAKSAFQMYRVEHVGDMAPQFVKPYVKFNKNDIADAEAICEVVGWPNMRFVPMKNNEQQAILSVYRARQGFVKTRTAQANQMRELLSEFGPSSRKISDRLPSTSLTL